MLAEMSRPTRAEIAAMVAEGLAGADDVVQRAWARLAMPLAEWGCEGAPDDERFWVVGRIADEVAWYNHIEEGFNRSPCRSERVIGEYRCNQSTFADLLAGLPEALEARRSPKKRPTTSFPHACARAATSNGVRRPTGTW
jgi:hypothetical protein